MTILLRSVSPRPMLKTWSPSGRRRRSRRSCRWCEAVKDWLNIAKDFIGTLGFPVFVATLLLYRVEAWHTQNIHALNELRIAILDRHLAIHCRNAAIAEKRRRRARRPKDKRR